VSAGNKNVKEESHKTLDEKNSSVEVFYQKGMAPNSRKRFFFARQKKRKV